MKRFSINSINIHKSVNCIQLQQKIGDNIGVQTLWDEVAVFFFKYFFFYSTELLRLLLTAPRHMLSRAT